MAATWNKAGCSSLIQILFLHLDVPHPDQPPPAYPPPPSPGYLTTPDTDLHLALRGVGEKQSYREEEEEAGLKEGAGRIRLQAGPGNNVVCTCYAQQASGCTLPV